MTLAAVFTSPHLIDLILAGIILEAAVVIARRGLTPLATLSMLAPGVFIMLALRAALAGAAWPWVPACLAAAGVAHLFDMKNRWRR
jgi:hypothetical protein